ncbi:hypothetical protein DNTS_018080 [Danionella cerebrum]|uniref:WW domain binding protein VOPP1 n=1 Tax=Danionella cerebrum TaxID=2873325 RepID=A0A553QGX2_9TELE|nr:hypothetical protein DNTS_018080 [Danionella translucida]
MRARARAVRQIAGEPQEMKRRSFCRSIDQQSPSPGFWAPTSTLNTAVSQLPVVRGLLRDALLRQSTLRAETLVLLVRNALLLLMLALLFCCGAGFCIRRRIFSSALREEPAFNVSFTRHTLSAPVSQQPVVQGYPDPIGSNLTPAPPLLQNSYPPPPSYCNLPPPSYEQLFRGQEKKSQEQTVQ